MYIQIHLCGTSNLIVNYMIIKLKDKCYLDFHQLFRMGKALKFSFIMIAVNYNGLQILTHHLVKAVSIFIFTGSD